MSSKRKYMKKFEKSNQLGVFSSSSSTSSAPSSTSSAPSSTSSAPSSTSSKRGPYKQKAFISNKTARTKQEKQSLSTLSRVLSEMKTRTRTPAVYLAFSEGKLVGNASSTNLKRFVEDPVVQQLFQKYILNENVVDDEISDKQDEGTDGPDYLIKGDWKTKKNALEKRTLVCSIVSWSTKGQVRWRKEFAPTWWPKNIIFESPHGKLSRPSVVELEIIIEAFLHFQQYETLNGVYKDADNLFEELMSFSTASELLNRCKKIKEYLALIKDFNFNVEECKFKDDLDISYRYLLNSTLRDSMSCLRIDSGCYAQLFSWCLWQTNKYWKLLKLLGFVYNINNIESLKSFIIQGGLGKSPEAVQESIQIDPHGESFSEDMLEFLKSNAHCTDNFLTLHGIVNALKLNTTVIVNESHHHEIHLSFQNGHDVNYIDINGTVLRIALLPLEVNSNVCFYNQACKSLPCNNLVIECPRCLHTYHQLCIKDNETCGCDKVIQYRDSVNVFQNAGYITRCLPLWKNDIKVEICQILTTMSIERRNLLQKSFGDDCYNRKLDAMNYFFENNVLNECKNLIVSFITAIFSDNKLIRESLNKCFDLSKTDEVIQRVIYPEISKMFIKRKVKEKNLPSLVFERILRRAVREDAT